MIVKILGIIDLLISLIIFSLVLGLNIPNQILIVCIVILGAKSLFIFTGDIASWIDVFAAIILALSLATTMPRIFLIIVSFLLLQKGFFSLV